MSAFELRRGADRGALDAGWLRARFSFPFGEHVDPAHPRFGPLLALNEDRVQPGTGFPMHPHRDLEIVMLPRRGAVEHQDSQGRRMTVRPGELQWMRAGRGIRHRQWNASDEAEDHHFQIWFEPGQRGLEPAVERRPYATPAPGTWRVLVAPAAEGADALDIGVDVRLALGAAAPGAALALPARPGGLYLHLMAGRAKLHGAGAAPLALQAGDAVAFPDGAPALRLQTDDEAAELLRFDTGAVDPHTGRARRPLD